jgi:hypothetical protein
MGTQNDSLSVLQSVAAEKNQTAAPAQSSPQDSLSVLQDVAGVKPINMVGPKGEKVQVPQNQVVDMRQQNFAVTPDNPDAQKVVTADGQVAYVLPDEVQKFEDLGATKIHPDGMFMVKNLRSDNTEFPDSIPDVRTRAVNVAKALGDEGMKKSMKAEVDYHTSKEGIKDDLKGLANVGIVGGGTVATLAGAGPTISAAKAAIPAAINTGALVLASPAGQTVIKEGGKWLIKGAVGSLGWKLANMWFGK